MIVIQKPNEDIVKSVIEDHERLVKEAEEALDANKKNAEEIEKNHGEDTKKPVSNSNLKAMHLSESLFEDLDSNDYDEFEHDLYDSIKKICLQYFDVKDNMSYRDIENAINNFLEIYEDDEDFDIFFSKVAISNVWIKNLEDKFDEINPIKYKESLSEASDRKLFKEFKIFVDNRIFEISHTPQRRDEIVEILNKQYPDSEIKVVPYNHYESGAGRKSLERIINNQLKDYNECLDEEIKRYSDVVPKEQRKYWYFTTHGVQPGSIPKGLNVLEIRDGKNNKGTNGTFVCLDGILNTSELKDYDMKEMAPPENVLAESIKYSVAKNRLQKFQEGKMPKNWNPEKFLEGLVAKKHITESQANNLKAQYLTEDVNSITEDRVELLRIMNETMISINDERAYMTWIEVVPDQASLEDFADIAEDDSDFSYVTQLFNTLYKQYHASGLVSSDPTVHKFCEQKDKELKLNPIEVM